MKRILDIAAKDLLEMMRDRKTFMFLLLMPVIFTLLFSYAFSGGGASDDDAASDPRLPVGWIDQDNGRLSQELQRRLAASPVIRLETRAASSPAELEAQVADGKLAAAILVPAGYTDALATGLAAPLDLIAGAGSPAGRTVEGEVSAAARRLVSAARTAEIVAQAAADPALYAAALDRALAGWEQPPVTVSVTAGAAEAAAAGSTPVMSPGHTAPGMMLQFAIAGLLTAAQVIVNERKSRSLPRLLTTSVGHTHILLGHFLGIFVLIFAQFGLLVLFGQIFLQVAYLRVPAATLLVMVAAALCIAALGLLIGVLARNEEQAIIFSLIPMFVFSGLGGAWMPLELTGATFQAIGHLSPVAWAMDGFKNIAVRGLGFESVTLPALALLGYAVLFFGIAVWRFRTAEQQ